MWSNPLSQRIGRKIITKKDFKLNMFKVKVSDSLRLDQIMYKLLILSKRQALIAVIFIFYLTKNSFKVLHDYMLLTVFHSVMLSLGAPIKVVPFYKLANQPLCN